MVASEYSVGAGDEAASNQDTDSAKTQAARKALDKARERWNKVLKTSVDTKSAVQHIVDVLEPLREKDEVVAPMSDDTLLQHLRFAESKLQLISDAFAAMDSEHKELLSSVSAPLPKGTAPSTMKKDPSQHIFERQKDPDESDEEFEEELEDEVMDRDALKRQSFQLMDKGAKKKKPKKKRAKGGE